MSEALPEQVDGNWDINKQTLHAPAYRSNGEQLRRHGDERCLPGDAGADERGPPLSGLGADSAEHATG